MVHGAFSIGIFMWYSLSQGNFESFMTGMDFSDKRAMSTCM